MCGLNGMFGNIGHVDKKIQQELLIVSSMRGPHSTGLGYVPKNQTAGYVKLDTPPHHFLADDDVKRVFDQRWHSLDVVLGHNRYATRGNVTAQNAHPFLHDHILLTHNGHINNGGSLFKDIKSFEVDSEYIAYAFSKAPHEDVIKEISGAFCLAWWDDKADSFFLVRNDERPICIAKNKNRDVWYYASERNMLEFVIARSAAQIEEPFTIKPGDLLSWNRSSPKELNLKTIKLKSWYTSPSQRAWTSSDDTYPPRLSYQNGQYKRVGETNQGSPAQKTQTSTTGTTAATKGKIVSLDDYRKHNPAKLSGAGWTFDYGSEWLKSHGVYISGGTCDKSIYVFLHAFNAYPNHKESDIEHVYGEYRGCLASPDAYASDKVVVKTSGKRLIDVIDPDTKKIKHGLFKGRISYANYNEVTEKIEITVTDLMPALTDVGCFVLKPTEEELKREQEAKKAAEQSTKREEEEKTGQSAFIEVITRDEVDEEAGWVYGPKGTMIKPEEYQRLTSAGCAYCSCDIALSHNRVLCWNRNNEPFCRDCAATWQSHTGETFESKIPLRKKELVRAMLASANPNLDIVDVDDDEE